MGRKRKIDVPGIREVSPGRYMVRVTEVLATGRRVSRQRQVEGSLSDAMAVREALLTDNPPAPTERPTRPRFSDFAEQWIADVADRIAPSTVDRYTRSLAHAVVGLGQYWLDELTPGAVRDWLARLAHGRAPTTINASLRVLKVALNDAVRDGLIPSNPAAAVRPRREGPTQGRRGRSLTPEQFARFIEAARQPERCNVAPDIVRNILFLSWTGARRAEAFALRWGDVEGQEVVIRRSVWRGLEKPPKSGRERRVPLVEPLRELLDEQRRWLLARQHPGLVSGLVFPADPSHRAAGAKRRRPGAPDVATWHRTGSALDRPLRRLCAAAGVPELSCHALRRTFADALRRAGVDTTVRRSLAGWAGEGIQGRYETADASERAAAGAAVVRLVARSANPDGAATPDSGVENGPMCNPGCATRAQEAETPDSGSSRTGRI